VIQPGGRFGDFTILAELGRGGMGAVYHARDGSGREVALKVVTGRLTDTARGRFEREGQLTASLRHPGIVPVHAAGDVDGVPYLTYGLVKDARPLGVATADCPREDRLRLLEEIATALAHAHSRGVVHRDLKPENILVANGKPVIVDFGVAWVHDAKSLTRSGTMVGTPSHMAPEQLHGQTEVTHGPGTDVWALGVLLYSLLTNTEPFHGETLIEFVVAACQESPTPPRSHDPTITREVEWVCLKALEKRPARRFKDAAAFAKALGQARHGDTPLALTRRRQRNRALTAGAFVIACLGLSLLVIPKMRARRALERCSAIDHRLSATWGIGLIDSSTAPAAADLRAARANLEATRDALGNVAQEEAQRVADRLRVRGLYLSGEPLPEGTKGDVALVHVLAGVRALQANDTEELRRASEAALRLAPDLVAARVLALELELREEPKAFTRGARRWRKGLPRAVFERLARTHVELGYKTALASQAPSHAARVARDADALGVSLADQQRLKRSALAAEALRLTEHANTIQASESRTDDDLLATSGDFAVLATIAVADPKTLPVHGADATLRSILAVLHRRRPTDTPRLRRAIAIQDTGTRLGLPAEPLLLEMIWQLRQNEESGLLTPHSDVALAAVRYGYPLHTNFSHRRVARWILPPAARQLALDRPTSRATQYLALAVNLPHKSQGWEKASRAERLGYLKAIERVLADDLDDDLSSHYLGELHLMRALALRAVDPSLPIGRVTPLLAQTRALSQNDGLAAFTFAWLYGEYNEVDESTPALLAKNIERLRARLHKPHTPFMLDLPAETLALALLTQMKDLAGASNARQRLRLFDEVEALISLPMPLVAEVRAGQIVAHLELLEVPQAAARGDEVVRFPVYAIAVARLRLAQGDPAAARVAVKRARALSPSPRVRVVIRQIEDQLKRLDAQ
jgi:serine/threonine protein kinase